MGDRNHQHLKNPGQTEQAFRDLAGRYHEQSFERFPVAGSMAGRHEFDGMLGRCSPSVWQRQEQLVERTLAAVEDLPLQDFSAGGMLDRRALLAELRQERMQLVELRRWRNDPQIHLNTAAEAIHHLLVRHGDDLGAVAEPIFSRLKQIPRYLDEATECLERPEPLWRELAGRMAPSVARFFRAIESPLAAALAGHQRPFAVRKAIARAAEAAEDYGRRLKSIRAAGAGSFAIGEERLTRLMRERLGLDWSPREAVAFARHRIDWLREEMRREARRFDARRPPREILERAANEWRPEQENLLDSYRALTLRIRERFEEAALIDFPPGERLLVRPVPDFMREQFPTAAYSSPGAFDTDQTGIFWVNDLGEAVSPKQRAAELAQHFGIELTCAHEAYPGHHLQFTTQNRHPSPVRRLTHHAIYYEGWTLWCEQMLADLGWPENPHLRLLQLSDELWRAWRIVIDVGLQSGALGYDAAWKLLRRELGFTEARARGEINWYSAAPAVPMSYLIGKLELLRLKHQRVDAGSMSLREFNNWVLSFGAIPWRWIDESGL